MKGIIKFCKGEDVVYQRVYNSLEHRKLIIKQYYTRNEAVPYDSIVFSPEITEKNSKEIVKYLHTIGALVDIEAPEVKSIGATLKARQAKRRRIRMKVQDGQGRIFRNMMEASAVLGIHNSCAYQMAKGKRNNRFGLKYIA